MNALANVSVSHGTHRPIDLINVFATTLHKIDGYRTISQNVYREAYRAFRLLHILEQHNQYPSARLYERSSEIIERLIDALNSLAPEGYYFGVHPGDGSDFGFWSLDEDDDYCPF